MELKTVKDVFDDVTKTQKLCYYKCHEAIGHMGNEIEHALEKLQTTDANTSYPDHNTVLSDLNTKLKEIGPQSQMESNQKELNITLTKYPKLLEKTFNPDVLKGYKNVDFDVDTVNQVIASHLYREGMFNVGDCFAHEAGQVEAISTKTQFIEMYNILQALKSRNLDPALKWAASNCEKIRQNGSDLELKLHKLQYVEILQNQGRDEALKYARTFLSPFGSNDKAEIRKMMACLLWSGKLELSPYADLLSISNWDKLAMEFTRQFCHLLGQSFESPLSLTLEAGVESFSTFLKLMSVMIGKNNDWQSMEQLPVPIDLNKKFQFHTIFVCPVSRDQATEENRPMLMSCGHALCKQSIVKLSKSSTKTFKCPYCPAEVEASHCRQLFF